MDKKENEETSQPKEENTPEYQTDKKSGRGFRLKKEKTGKEEELQKQVAETADKLLRVLAEFDNYRKRTAREKQELTEQASSDLIFRLLPVLDDFDRALKAHGEQEESIHILEGFGLIHNKFRNILEQKGLQEMQALEETFNTDFHEALTNIPAPSEAMKGKVVDVIEKGYLLHGKVLRFARVVVGN